MQSTDVSKKLPDFIQQAYDDYSREEHDVWKTLYERRMPALETTASTLFLQGAAAIGLSSEVVPELSEINRRLATRTGWRAVAVSGFIPASQFFRCLASRSFPTTVRIRPRAQLDYLPEPDIFHDVFGHVPLHADPVFADFLQRFGDLGDACRSEEQTTALARLFWFTVEFGLIREAGSPRIYGSGLISSHGDAANALSEKCERRPFALSNVITTPFQTDEIQPMLYELESFNDLFVAVEELSAQFGS